MNTRFRIVLLILFGSLFFALQASAQLDLGLPAQAGVSDVTLSLSPEHPAPGALVHITARSSSLNLDFETISWFVNGAPQKTSSAASIDTTAGPLGSETGVGVIVSENGAERAVGSAIIRPTEMDLLWEADSYTPPFFAGRALPSAGTGLRLEAIPRFVRTDGSFVPTSDIVFTWRRNNSVISSVSGRGASRAFIDAPPLFGTDVISVDAQSADGALSASASARIPSIDPLLGLYQDHPLFGTLYNQELGAQTVLTETEMSFAAVPYFAQASDANDPGLTYTWQVNGKRIANDPKRPSEITLNAQNSSGAALIDLALTSPINFFLQSSGRWGVVLSGGNAGNPFESASGAGATP